MSRIFRHISANDLRRTRQRQIGEQKEYAAQKLKEWQEAEVERKQIEEAARPYKSNWRRENLREFGEWAPIETSGPTNSTSTTFGYFSGGSPVINGETGQQVTFTYSGLDGVENYPTTVTINQGFGDTFQTAPPPFSQVGVQGYTAKLNPRYAEAKKKYDEEWKEWERKKEQQRKDIETTLKSFGTSYRDVQRDGGITKVGNSYVAIIPTNTRDFGSNLLNNVRVVRLVPCDPSQPMELTKNVRDISGTKKWNVSNAQYSHDVYLQIGEQPKAPIEQEYLMPRRTDFKDVNPQLDASQEFAQKVGADKLMNARVKDVPEQPSFSKIANNTSVLPTFDGVPRHNPLANLTQLPMGFPYSDAIGNTLRYATGNYDPKVPIKGGQSAALELAVLNSIENEIRSGRIRKDPNRPGYFTVRGDQQSYEGPGGSLTNNYLTNASAQGFLQAYSFKPGKKGVDVKDRFNLTGGRNIGGAAFVSNAINYWLGKFGANASFPNFEQEIVDTLVDIGDNIIRQRGGDPKDDSTAGFDVEFTIPWERIPNNHLLRGKRKKKEEEEVVESTWSKLKKHQKRG